MSEDYLQRKIREAKELNQCKEEIGTLMFKYGAQNIMRGLGQILQEAEGVGNGYSVGRVLIELSEVEW